MADTSGASPSLAKNGPVRYRILIVVSLVAISVFLIHACNESAQNAKSRRESRINLKQIYNALQEHQSSFGELPRSRVEGPNPQPQHGWQSRILPFLESSPWIFWVDFQRPWDNPKNIPGLRFHYSSFLIPGTNEITDERGLALSHYAGNAEILGADKPVKLSDLNQGSTHTVLAGEIAENFLPWGKPGNYRDPAKAPNSGPESYGRPTRDGAMLLNADGSIRFVSNHVDQAIYKSLSQSTGPHPRYHIEFHKLRGDLQIFLQKDQVGRVAMAIAPWHDKMSFRNGKLIAKDKLKDEDLAIFLEMRHHLENLDVSGSELTDDGISVLQKLDMLQVLSLTLPGPGISSRAVGRLAGLKNLKLLNISTRQDVQRRIEMLRQELPDCEINWRRLTDEQ